MITDFSLERKNIYFIISTAEEWDSLIAKLGISQELMFESTAGLKTVGIWILFGSGKSWAALSFFL